MNKISRAEFDKLSGEEAKKVMPVVLTLNGQPMAICLEPKDAIFLGDLHPRVRNMLKAMEARARVGMPKDVQTDAEELKLVLASEGSN